MTRASASVPKMDSAPALASVLQMNSAPEMDWALESIVGVPAMEWVSEMESAAEMPEMGST